jgi:hypothetical protein
MTRWLLAGDAAAALAEAVTPTAHPRERLEIYRNGSRGTLVNALRLAFPAVQRVVGEQFFEAAAQEFIGGHPPTSAYLNEYGAEFGEFLGTFAPAAVVPYLADLCALEWAVNRALHAEDIPAMGAARWAELQLAAQAHTAAQLQWVIHPSLSALRLRYPADSILRAVLEQDEPAMAAIDLTSGPVHLLIERDAQQLVQVSRIDAVSWRLTERLCAGVCLDAALQAALQEAGSEQVSAVQEGSAAGLVVCYDGATSTASLTAVLAEHLSRGRLTDFRPAALPSV